MKLIDLDGNNSTLQGEDGKAFFRLPESYSEGVHKFAMLAWDSDLLSWVKFTGGDPTAPTSNVFVMNFPASQIVSGPLTDIQLRATPVPVSAASLPLPSNASTSALQTTGNTSLSNIDTKTPALGQALAAASTPVVLTAAQLTTLTPLSSVSVSNFPATQPVSGTVSTKTALTASSPTAASVAATTGQAVASNSSRKGLILTNTSNNYISLGLGASAVLYSGITLSPYGTFVMDEFSFTTGAVNAIASVASSNLAIQEYT